MRAVNLVPHAEQSGHVGPSGVSADGELFCTSGAAEQLGLESPFECAAEELRAMAAALPGGFADIARYTGYSESTVGAWANPERPDKMGRHPAWLKYRLPPDALRAAQAHERLTEQRLTARSPATLPRALSGLHVATGELHGGLLTNEPAAVLRPLVREVVEAALRIDATFATCRKCRAERFAASVQCDSCGHIERNAKAADAASKETP